MIAAKLTPFIVAVKSSAQGTAYPWHGNGFYELRNGLVYPEREYVDSGAMMAQLGLAGGHS